MTQAPYKMGTISRLTGLSPILLRAWERRYGLLRPERGRGGQRLFTQDDLDVLERTQELLKEGRSIGEVAALGRDAILGLPAEIPQPLAAGRSQAGADSGGTFLDTRRADVIRSAITLDPVGLNRALDEAAAAVSFPALIERIIEPAAREIGDLWQAGKCTIASEHLATAIFGHRIRKIMDATESVSSEHTGGVVAAGLPGEEHVLGLLILCYFLGLNGVRVLFLGASLPFPDLRQACLVRRPRAVLMSVTIEQTFRERRQAIKELLAWAAPGTAFYVGGQGAPSQDRELEAAGLRLGSTGASAQETAQSIVGNFGAGGKVRSRRKTGSVAGKAT